MDIEDLEIAFNHFFAFRDDYHSFEDIHATLNETGECTLIETKLIIQKLVRDGYVIGEVLESIEEVDRSSVPYGYFITYDGLMFSEQGGYRYLHERMQEKAIY